MVSLQFTSADIEVFPDNGKRYEIVSGDLYVSKQPHWHHQFACSRLITALGNWCAQTKAGVVNVAPGLIFAEDDDVVPDVVWVSSERLVQALHADGKLHAAPELVVEVLSPGQENEHRDKETKRKLYSRRGVQEYWIINWRLRLIEVYRRQQAVLQQVETFYAEDDLCSPLLPGFVCPVRFLFDDMVLG